MRIVTRRTSALFLIIIITFLNGCKTLQTAEISESEINSERTKQIQLVNKLNAERKARLRTITSKLRPEAIKVCQKYKDVFDDTCRYPVKLRVDSSINAAADGNTVYINSGIINFVTSDDELALVVGHEMAHNMLNHIDKKIGSTLIGAIIDGLILGATGVDTGGAFTQLGSTAYSQDYETEADYLGLYLAARAGYDISDAPNLWRRMGIESPGSIVHSYNSTHPSTPQRYVALESAVREINTKDQDKLALLPNLIEDNNKTESDALHTTPDEEYAYNVVYDEYGRQKATFGPNEIKEQQNHGRWAFQAEQYSKESQCRENPPVATLINPENNQHGEIYEVACGELITTVECSWGQCKGYQ